jgi:DNA-binding SARP family transcriptional activator
MLTMDAGWGEPGPWHLLGPVRWQVDGAEVELGPAKQRAVVAALLLTPGRSVPIETLVDRLWDGRAPRAGNAVAPYITRLRRILEAGGEDPALLRFVAGGYRFGLPADRVDLHRARRLAADARAAGQSGADGRAAALLRQAVAGWEPVALAGLPGEWAQRVRESLHRERLDLLADLAEAELRLGQGDRVLAELRSAVAEHPTSERLAAALMRVLAAGGQVAEALDCYARLRDAVAEEFGSEPAAAVRELHVELLRERATPPVRGGGPAQLPADVAAFTARAAELRRLDDALDEGGDATGTMVISAVSGTAGVGKTALAVHWAHRVRHRFPDGQLFVNLGGFGPADRPVAPDEALRGFLTALGVPDERIARDLRGRSAQFRTLVADRRLLVVLDNARDADQVRPLLPGSPGSMALVTSRDLLLSLIAVEAARALPLDLLTAVEAEALLTRRLGAARVAAEPEALRRIITACARLPIALAVVAARAAAQPALSLAVLADQVSTADGLDVLTAHDASSDVRAVLSWSYRALSPATARLFRLLGLHPGPECSRAAAASLAGLPPRRTVELLEELVRAHLVTPTANGGYELHDLLRAYAAERVAADEDEAGRAAAVDRLLDHYLHGACRAAGRLQPTVMTAPPARPGTVVDEIPDATAALAWFTENDPVLVNLIRGTTGHDGHVWRLVRGRELFAVRQGRWSDLVELQRLALDAVRRTGERPAEAEAVRSLARAHLMSGELDEAHRHALAAVGLFCEIGDKTREAQTHHLLTDIHGRLDDQRTALRHARRALALYEAADDRLGTARALNAAGWSHAVLGEYDHALEHCERAVTSFRALGDRDGEAATEGSLGYTREHLRDFTAAIAHYERAAHLCRELGERFYLADTLTHLGDCQVAAGRAEAARRAWDEALSILDDLGHPAAAGLRGRLSGPVPAP